MRSHALFGVVNNAFVSSEASHSIVRGGAADAFEFLFLKVVGESEEFVEEDELDEEEEEEEEESQSSSEEEFDEDDDEDEEEED